MRALKIVVLCVLIFLLPLGCGDQLVEFGGQGADGGNLDAGHSGAMGSSGATGNSGAGNSGTGNVDAGNSGAGNLDAGELDAGELDAGDAGNLDGGNDAPVVTSSNPADDDSNVAINKIVTATFSEAMHPGTITDVTFTLMDGLTSVPGQVSFSGNAGDFVAIFTPDSNLAPDTLFTATITTGATDLSDLALADDYVWTFTTGTEEAQTVMQVPIDLGESFGFVILASAAITNIPTSDITGDVGLTPDAASNVSGFSTPATCPEVTGTIYVVDATGPACAVVAPTVLTDAKSDAEDAFINARAAVRGTPQAIAGNINGLTLYPGLYESGTSLEISAGGFLYLDAQGDDNAIFIIRSATSITTEDTSEVVLTKGAKASNVYWTAGSAVTLGTDSIMKGTFIAGTSISLLTGANLEGRALNQGAAAEAITLDACTITLPSP